MLYPFVSFFWTTASPLTGVLGRTGSCCPWESALIPDRPDVTRQHQVDCIGSAWSTVRQEEKGEARIFLKP